MNALLTFFIVLYAIVCVLLILLVIVQGGRAEGLFASAQANVLGSRGTDMLTKITRVLSGIFILGALLISIFISGQRGVLDNSDFSAPAGTLTEEEAQAMLEAEAAAEAERLAAEEAAAKAAADAAARRTSSSASGGSVTNNQSDYDEFILELSQSSSGGE